MVPSSHHINTIRCITLHAFIPGCSNAYHQHLGFLFHKLIECFFMKSFLSSTLYLTSTCQFTKCSPNLLITSTLNYRLLAYDLP